MRRAAATAGVLAALVLAGCGGHAATRADVIARGNAICATANAAIRAVPSSGSGADPQLARYFTRVAPILDRQAASLRTLPRPAPRRTTLDALIQAETRVAAEYHQLAAATRAGDQAAVQSALAQLAASPVSSLAAGYGLSQCTGSAATVR